VKRLLVILIVAIALISSAQEIGVGMEIRGFRVPDYDDEGHMRAQLFGGYAVILENSEVQITNIKIEIYQKGRVAMIAYAPRCFYSPKRNEAYSNERVLIEMGPVVLVGRGFVWSAKGGRFEILNDARVVVKNAGEKLKELKSKR